MILENIVQHKQISESLFKKIKKKILRYNHEYALITDYPKNFEGNNFNIVDIQDVSSEYLEQNKHLHFFYAVENNSLGLPLIKKFIEHNIIFFPIEFAGVGGYVYDNKLARDIIEEEYVMQFNEGFSKFSDPGTLGDYVHLCQALENTKKLTGDVVEIGVYRGSSSCIIVKYLKHILSTKAIWFFDTFEGFNYIEAENSPDRIWNNTHATEGIEIISERIRNRDPNKHINVKKLNIITDDLPSDIKKISVCNIDVDMLEAVESALIKVSKLIEVGGIIVCEDAGHTPATIGARLALEKFLKTEDAKTFMPMHLDTGQVFLIKISYE